MNTFISCLLSIIGVVLTAYLGYVFYLMQRSLNRKRMLRCMTYEVADTIRHIYTGLRILEQAKNGRMLSPMHFKKMKISEHSLFFDAEMIRYYPADHDRAFRKCALLLRNHNLELDAIISHIESVCGRSSFDTDFYRKLLEYYKKKSRLLLTALQHELCRLRKGKCEQCPMKDYNMFSLKPTKKGGSLTAEELYDRCGRCSIEAEVTRNWSPWYRNIPFLSDCRRTKAIRKHVRNWKAPDSVGGVIYTPSV